MEGRERVLQVGQKARLAAGLPARRGDDGAGGGGQVGHSQPARQHRQSGQLGLQGCLGLGLGLGLGLDLHRHDTVNTLHCNFCKFFTRGLKRFSQQVCNTKFGYDLYPG